MHKKLLIIVFVFLNAIVQAQITGDLQSNVNFFQRDTNIKASDNALYDHVLSGGEAWLALRYAGKDGFSATVRFDGFHNSNLLTLTSPYTGAGIGMFNLTKEMKNFTISAGHIYDQIGSGILFRAYEDRGLLIDNALFGLQLKTKLREDISVKGFTGQSRNLFTRWAPILKGINIEKESDTKQIHFTTGIGAVNRTMDEASMGTVVQNVNSLPNNEKFVPRQNMYAFTLYNTLTWKDITWYIEGAYKSFEAINNLAGSLVGSDGNIVYTTLGWAPGKFGVNASFKRTDHFNMRTSPNEILLKGMINWQPVIALIRPQRLIARYTPPSQDFSEQALAVNAYYTPTDNLTTNLTLTHINDLSGTKLYREIFADAEYRGAKDFIIHPGFQYLEYNQPMYQQKGSGILHSYTPFIEITKKLKKNRSVRVDLQYMNMDGDYGSWAYALLEYTIAPKFSFTISDMYNVDTKNSIHGSKKNHYPNAFVAYTKGANRYTFQWVKQVEGINCTGGVCRYEPAFSGFKFGCVSSF